MHNASSQRNPCPHLQPLLDTPAYPVSRPATRLPTHQRILLPVCSPYTAHQRTTTAGCNLNRLSTNSKASSQVLHRSSRGAWRPCTLIDARPMKVGKRHNLIPRICQATTLLREWSCTRCILDYICMHPWTMFQNVLRDDPITCATRN